MNVINETKKYKAKAEKLRTGFIAKLRGYIKRTSQEVKVTEVLILETTKLKEELQSGINEAEKAIKENV